MQIAELAKGFTRAITNSQTWPAFVPVRVIQPGLAKYEDPKGINGTVLIEKPTLDKMAPTLRGRPVVDQMHKDAKPENFKEIADGLVFRVWFEPKDGWYWAELAVWDDATLKHCQDPAYFVSCAYEPTEINQKAGKHNNVEYDAEFLNGEYTHVAIVKDPRYEGAIIDREHIVFNSKSKGEGMNLFKIFSRKVVENNVSGDMSYAMCNGEKVMLHALVDGYKKDKADEEDRKNALADDAVVDIEGEKVPVKNLLDAHMKRNAKACNAEEKKEEPKKEEAENKSETPDEKKAEKREGEPEAENEIEGAATKESGEKMGSTTTKDTHADPENEGKKTAANALGDKKGKHIEEFKETIENRRDNNIEMPVVLGSSERLALGAKKYGRKPGGA